MSDARADDPFGGDSGGGFGNLHIADYLQILRRHWQLIAGTTLICGLGGLLHFVVTPETYRATATIQIERRSLINLSGGDTNPWLENYWNQEYYPTQYRLLQSRGLAERVVRRLRSGAAAGGAGSTVDEKALGDQAMGVLGGLSISPIAGTQLVELNYVSGDRVTAAQVANAFADAYIEWGVDSRSATSGRANELLTDQIDNTKSELAERERLLQDYGRKVDIVSIEPGSNPLQNRLESLNAAYSEATAERVTREARWRELISTAKETLADTLSSGTVGQVRSELLAKQREYDGLLKRYKPEYPRVQQLKTEIDKLERDLASLIDETVRQERDRANTDYQTALRREQGLAAQLEKAKGENLQLNTASGQYRNLSAEVQTLRTQLQNLLQQQSNTELTGRLQSSGESNVRVVDRALVPGGPVAPSLRKDLSTGTLLGLLLGVGCVALIEFLDRTIKTADQVERLLGLPTLAVIPDTSERGRGYGGYGYGQAYGYGGAAFESKGGRDSGVRARPRSDAPADPADISIELLPHFKPRLVTAEAYRALRTALLLSSAEELRVIAVTSAQSGEGKTVTSANLAVVMAQLGRQVLLIDGDLRRPRVHEVFRVSNRAGLVTFLTGGGKAEQVFQRSQVPNLWITPSGPAPPNPSELLSSARMREFVALARQSFDFVIIDTPPVLAVTDASVVGTLTDGVVLCLRARKVLQEDAKACRDRLRLADLRILGTVLNRHRERKGVYGRGQYGSQYAAKAYGAEQDGEDKAGARNPGSAA
jgi:capsular exopolysaccharide synthesis family protein